MVDDAKQISFVPSWVKFLGTPVWIRDPAGMISFLNSRAERLLGRSAIDVIGNPCHQIVGGSSVVGVPFCRRQCLLVSDVMVQAEIEPIEMLVQGGDDKPQWVRFLAIPVWAPDGSGPWIVHCALSANREHRFNDYLTRVAAAGAHAKPKNLTGREREILQHLVEGEDLHIVAERLFISHATVRNHVQHILAKLDVHSINQAVAHYLLSKY
ncbi:MAG: PAS and helix-turn-helix domain-containing protein [Acidobacteriota bacterium]|nr:PAS and helix-turn-helix domain-containing protein [Acidobacteriota bacterium]